MLKFNDFIRGININDRNINSITAKYIFFAVFILWLISEVIGGWIIPILRRHGSHVNEKMKVLDYY